MVAVAADAAQVVAAEVEAVPREQLVDALVWQRRPLELEEQQRRFQCGAALLRELEQRAVLRVGRVCGEAQRRVRPSAPREVLDRGELLHRRPEVAGVELFELARVARRESLRALERLGEALLDALRPLSLDERVEVPRRPRELLVG